MSYSSALPEFLSCEEQDVWELVLHVRRNERILANESVFTIKYKYSSKMC